MYNFFLQISASMPCFSFHGVFPSMRQCTFKTYEESHQGGVPLVVYNRSDPSLPMAVFSPLDWPKAQHVATESALVGIGVKATVDSIPAGWSHRSILMAGIGIGDGAHGGCGPCAYRPVHTVLCIPSCAYGPVRMRTN